ncbi:MAG: hypothetical protein V2A58_03125, partial [Planctomycetota bacterium]
DRLYEEDARADSPLWRKVKECISVLIAAGKLLPELAAAGHAAGMEIYSYANPQSLNTNPGTFRRNYGLALWKAGYDGAMDYAYNSSFGLCPWNDFDYVTHTDYRYRGDMGFVVSTSTGCVDSVAWEGFAAGVNDVRYLSTLLREIAKAPRSRPAREAARWLAGMDIKADPDALRRRIIRWILKLEESRRGR